MKIKLNNLFYSKYYSYSNFKMNIIKFKIHEQGRFEECMLYQQLKLLVKNIELHLIELNRKLYQIHVVRHRLRLEVRFKC